MLLFVFLWAKGLNANEIHSEMHPVYGDKCLMRPAIHVWCTKFAHGRESIVDMERQQPASFFGSGIQKLADRWEKCLNELGQYVENETLMFNI